MKLTPAIATAVLALTQCSSVCIPCTRDTPILPVDLVLGSDAIVRARVDDYTAQVRGRQNGNRPELRPIRFDVLEVLKGDEVGPSVELQGYLVQGDDFNERTVPYDFVRPAGRKGSCFAFQYKRGAEYLIFFLRHKGAWTLYPDPLAPVNEQLRSSDDRWVLWVRAVWEGAARATQLTGSKIPADAIKPGRTMSHSPIW